MKLNSLQLYKSVCVALLLSIIVSSMNMTDVSAKASAASQEQKLSPAGLLNADGSLNLNTSASGNLDLSGYTVSLDPARGPVFSPLVVTPNAWNALGTGVNSAVAALAISGTDVYVGGLFTAAGGVANADRIAKWDGSSWSALATGLNNYINAIAVSGTDVYVGGAFTDAGGVANADKIAKWNGSSWSALGTGVNDEVASIAISGTDVYVGGLFTDAGGVANADKIAKWNGSSWSALGTGANDFVLAIAISGADVYAGGTFTDAGGVVNTNKIAKWNGSSWSALGTGVNNTVFAITISGADVYAGGGFTNAGGDAAADYIAKWNGSSWSALGTGLSNPVYAIAISGADVYVGGAFTDAGGNADYIARWNGSSWSALGTGLNNTVNAIAISGTDVYAGGTFTDAGGDVNADRVAMFATCGASITVTSGADSGSGSLREALANVCAGGTITFDNDYHILLDSTLAITKDLTIDGAGHKIELDGQNTVRVMYTEWSPVTATVKNLTIQNGHADTILGISAKAGGGILNLGKLTVNNVTFSDNTATDIGGALYARDITWVVNSTFSGNSSGEGGAIYDQSVGYSTGMVIHNTTFSGNSATVSGGAIDATLGAVYIHNSIIANSISGGNCAGNVINSAPNLDSGSTCGFGISNTDPKLAPLADNGGPTPTFALLSDSPAINAGSNLNCESANVGNLDQRGAVRPQGTQCDLGSYEAFIVTNADDSGAGSLRQNLADVIPNGPIIFDNDYHILLNSTLAVTKNLTIDGSGHAIILDGQDTMRVMYTEWSPVTATVRNLTIQNGNATTSVGIVAIAGGGILNLGTLNVANVSFINNSAVDYGGALYSVDTMTITNSSFSGNSADYGGAVGNGGTETRIRNATFSDNSAATSGGAIDASVGTVYAWNTIIANSTFGGNCAGTVVDGGYNLDSGATCGFTDPHSLSSTNPKLGPLANNGGLTKTFALLSGSPALDAGWNAICGNSFVQNLDQRGVVRPQGAACDIGSFEVADSVLPQVFLDTKPATTTTSKSASFTFHATDNFTTDPNFGFWVRLDGGSWQYTTTPSKSYSNLAAGKHNFYIKAEDDLGNTSGNATYSWTVQTERAKNGGLNTYPGISKVPTNWVKNTAWAVTDGKDTQVKKSGLASVKIGGQAGKTKTLTQTLALSGNTGDKFTFTFWSKGTAMPAAGLCRGQVMLYNGATLKLTKTISCSNSAGFVKKTLSFNATSAYTQVVIKFTYSKASGSVWFDAISLLK